MLVQTANQTYQNAINAARKMGGAAIVTAHGRGKYSVPASDGVKVYIVQVHVDGRYTCTCEAGKAGRPACKHRGATYMFRLAKRALQTAKPKPVYKTLEQLFDEAGIA